MKGILKLLPVVLLVMLTFAVLAQVSRDNDPEQTVKRAELALNEAKESGDANLIRSAKEKLEAVYQDWIKQNYLDQSEELQPGYRQHWNGPDPSSVLDHRSKDHTVKAVMERVSPTVATSNETKVAIVKKGLPQTATHLEYAPIKEKDSHFPIKLEVRK